MKDKDSQLIFEAYLKEDGQTNPADFDSGAELRRVDPRASELMEIENAFKQAILDDNHEEADALVDRLRVDFSNDWDVEDLAKWLIQDAGWDGASASELLSVEVNDHGDVLDHDPGAGEGRW
jgi:hypothetical protein